MDYLDGLRGIAALNVALAHFVTAFDFAIYSGRAEYAHGTWEVPLSSAPYLFLASGANFSVCIFLVLSGLVLARSFHRTSLGAVGLLTKRTIRLGLPVLAASLLGWVVLASGMAFNKQAAEVTRSAWLAIQLTQTPSIGDAFLQAWNSLLASPTLNNSYNSALWTMPIEFMGSILLIALFATGAPRRWPLRSGVLLLLVGLVLSRTFVSLMLFGAALYLLNVSSLAARLRWRPVLLAIICALGTVPFSEARGDAWGWLLWISAMVPALVSVNLPGFTAQGDVSLWHGLAAVGLVVLITGWPAAQRVLSSRVMRRLGDISFPLYLVHIPILLSVGCLAFLLTHGAGAPYWIAVCAAFVAYAPTMLLAAVVMEKLVDQPSLRAAARAAFFPWPSFRQARSA